MATGANHLTKDWSARGIPASIFTGSPLLPPASPMSVPAAPEGAAAPTKKGPAKAPFKLQLPHAAEAWLEEQFLANPGAEAHHRAQWLHEIQTRWCPVCTDAHLSVWIRLKRAHITRTKNASKKAAASREAQMEAQVFPRMPDLAKSTLRGLYALEPDPTQSLMHSWGNAVGVSGSEIVRWVQWKKAYDETTASKERASSSSVNVASAPPAATPVKVEHNSPLAAQRPLPPPIRTATGSAQARPGSSGSLTPSPSPSTYNRNQQPPPMPSPLSAPQNNSQVVYMPSGLQTSQPGPSSVGPRSAHPTSVHSLPPGNAHAGQQFATPYPPGSIYAPPGYGAYNPHSFGAPAPAPRPRDQSVPPIAVLEHGEPSTSPSGKQGYRVPPPPIATSIPPPRPIQLPPPGSPLDPRPHLPQGSAQYESRPSTASTRRRSHSPDRISPAHRRDGQPGRRRTPSPAPTTPTSLFRFTLPAGSPRASMPAGPSGAAAHAVRESEPPPARHQSVMSTASSSSRTVGGNPLTPLFDDLAATLRKEGLLGIQYPADLSASVPSSSSSAPRPPRAPVPAPAQASTGRAVHPSFASWCKEFESGLSPTRRAETDRIEAQQAEMLRDIESGAFAHLGLVAPPRKPKQEPDA